MQSRHGDIIEVSILFNIGNMENRLPLRSYSPTIWGEEIYYYLCCLNITTFELAPAPLMFKMMPTAADIIINPSQVSEPFNNS